MQGNRLPVEREIPLFGVQRCNYLVATTAATEMNGCHEGDRHIKDPIAQVIGDVVDELMGERVHAS
jgi:hypothetical protein